MKFKLIIALAAATMISGQALAVSNLVQNGDFETGTFANWIKSGNASLSDVIRNNVTSDTTYLWRSGATGSPAYISQDIATTIGAQYTLAFQVFNSATSNSSFSVDFGGASVYSFANEVHNYEPMSFVVTATNALSTLTFGARNDPSFVRLDNVSLTLLETPAAVPEPASWAMMLVGFGGVGYAMRRSRKVAVSFS